ncbi:MAG: methyltransferase C-terminal domain-containing protein [Burkholderiaceae bacterium]
MPDINDFIGGFKILLKRSGVATFEFHHVLKLLQLNQFDAIYHEHYYYHSLLTFQKILSSHGLEVFDVEQIPTHGGSLRVYAKHAGFAGHRRTDRVDAVLAQEIAAGLDTLAPYLKLEGDIRKMKRTFLKLVIEAKEAGKTIVAYGAAAKANTLLNYTGVGRDFIDYVVDKSTHKQGHCLPGVGIPILAPDKIFETRPDIVLILAWNLADEVEAQMAGIRAWGGQFLTLIPKVRLF